MNIKAMSYNEKISTFTNSYFLTDGICSSKLLVSMSARWKRSTELSFFEGYVIVVANDDTLFL